MRFCTAMPPPSAFTRSILRSVDRLAVIEEPVQAVEWNLSIHFFINVQGSLDRFVVCRVQAKWPAILYEMSNHSF